MSEDLQSLKLRGFFRSLDLETLLVLEPFQKVPLPLLFAKIYYCITLIFDLGKRPFILILNPSLQQSLLNPCNFVLVEFSSNKYKCYKSNPLTLDEPWKSSDEERQKSAPAMTGFFFLLFFLERRDLVRNDLLCQKRHRIAWCRFESKSYLISNFTCGAKSFVKSH